MPCKRCIERGKPENFASDPKCAFDTLPDRYFSSNNWNCETLNQLRQVVSDWYEEDIHYVEDSCLAVIPVSGVIVNIMVEDKTFADFLVLGWYKQRGTVDQAILIRDKSSRVLDLEKAEAILGYYGR